MSYKSQLEIFNIHTQEQKIVWQDNDLIEAPNWISNTQFIVNGGGKMYLIDLVLNKRTEIFTGFAQNCNNDHGITPDGKTLIISSHDTNDANPEAWKTSKIYKLPITGGVPEIITKSDCSFWHGISPDGETITYTANRKGSWDIYCMSIYGGVEIQLTSGAGHKDGSEYSPDGQFIYFNSFQSGSMEIWRMKSDGTNQVQITNDNYSNWFPHPSPNSEYLVYLCYMQNQGESHPFGCEVKLKIIDYKYHKEKVISKNIFGGQGTINVNSWSSDSSKFAFMSYNK